MAVGTGRAAAFLCTLLIYFSTSSFVYVGMSDNRSHSVANWSCDVECVKYFMTSYSFLFYFDSLHFVPCYELSDETCCCV